MPTTLTPEGKQYAETHSGVVPKVALNGRGQWPDAQVDAAIRVCNAQALKTEADYIIAKTPAPRDRGAMHTETGDRAGGPA